MAKRIARTLVVDGERILLRMKEALAAALIVDFLYRLAECDRYPHFLSDIDTVSPTINNCFLT